MDFEGTESAENSGWSLGEGTGYLDCKFGAEIFVSTFLAPPIPPKLCASAPFKVGLFSYLYLTGNLSSFGTFTNKMPANGVDFDFGIGGKLFASVSVVTPSFFPSWLRISEKVEWEFVKQKVFDYDYVSDPDECPSYDFIDFDPLGGNIILNAGCTGCIGEEYYVWINDSLINENNPFPYGIEQTIGLPSELDLVNVIEIADIEQIGCTLKEEFGDIRFNITEDCPVIDGFQYCTVQIGDQTWLQQNLRFIGPDGLGAWPNGTALTEPPNLINALGRLYTFNEILNGETPNSDNEQRQIKGICPIGYHIPTKAEFDALFNHFSNPNIALKFPSAGLWPNASLPSSNTFGAVPAGERYPWRPLEHGPEVLNPQTPSPQFGQFGKKAIFWTSTVNRGELSGLSRNNVVIAVVTNESINAPGNVGIGNNTDITSIEEIGYSCRCIKN